MLQTLEQRGPAATGPLRASCSSRPPRGTGACLCRSRRGEAGARALSATLERLRAAEFPHLSGARTARAQRCGALSRRPAGPAASVRTPDPAAPVQPGVRGDPSPRVRRVFLIGSLWGRRACAPSAAERAPRCGPERPPKRRRACASICTCLTRTREPPPAQPAPRRRGPPRAAVGTSQRADRRRAELALASPAAAAASAAAAGRSRAGLVVGEGALGPARATVAGVATAAAGGSPRRSSLAAGPRHAPQAAAEQNARSRPGAAAASCGSLRRAPIARLRGAWAQRDGRTAGARPAMGPAAGAGRRAGWRHRRS